MDPLKGKAQAIFILIKKRKWDHLEPVNDRINMNIDLYVALSSTVAAVKALSNQQDHFLSIVQYNFDKCTYTRALAR